MDKLRTKAGALVSRFNRWRRSLGGAGVETGPDRGSERGQGLVEYSLILALIAILAVGAVTFVGIQITGLLTDPVGTLFDLISP
jgi:Flp pilus assembly pilin Flp